MTTKKELSERDICSKYIQTALEKAGWNPLTQIREEVSFTDGRIYVKGNLTSRSKRKRADYILYYNSLAYMRLTFRCHLLEFNSDDLHNFGDTGHC